MAALGQSIWCLLAPIFYLCRSFQYKTGTREPGTGLPILKPIDLNKTVDSFREVFLKAGNAQKIFVPFKNPRGNYDNLFTGYRNSLELALYAGHDAGLNVFPNFPMVFKYNNVSDPDMWADDITSIPDVARLWGAEWILLNAKEYDASLQTMIGEVVGHYTENPSDFDPYSSGRYKYPDWKLIKLGKTAANLPQSPIQAKTNPSATNIKFRGMPSPEDILNATYCFILSTGRCGTALLSKILGCSPSLLVCHTPQPELNYVSSLIHKSKPDLESLKIAILAARFDLFAQAFSKNLQFVETNNRISFFASALYNLLPNAKFIHLIRHPGDFVRSGMRRQYYAEDVIMHQRLQSPDTKAWAKMNRLEKIAWEWNEINSAIESFKKECHHSSVITLKSEALFTQPECIRQIFSFMRSPNPFLTWSDDKMKRKLLSQPVNQQLTGTFPKYQDWTDQDKQRLKVQATLAPEYGYDLHSAGKPEA